MTTTSITGVTAVITGGGSGIMEASAIRLAADGAHVTIRGRTEDKLVAAVEEITPSIGEGGSVRHIVADVTVEEQIAAAVAFAAEPTGGLGILFANAGGSFHMGAFPDADAEALRATVDVNLVGTMLSIKHAVGAMRSNGGGSIIGMSSGAGAFPHRYLWAYGASKAGIDMLCKSAAEELGADGIRVNSVSPGPVITPLFPYFENDAGAEQMAWMNEQVGRPGQPEDQAEAVVWLAVGRSGWVNGVDLPVDGGLSAGMKVGWADTKQSPASRSRG